jgi:hypothetical protein
LSAPKIVLEDFTVLSRLPKKNLFAVNEILLYLCQHPYATAYDIFKSRRIYNVEYKALRRHINTLNTKGLVQSFRGRPGKKGKSWLLSTGGIAYLIINRKILTYSALKDVFRNYADDKLFQLLVFPYIQQKTILALSTLNSLLPISIFLRNSCIEIQRSLEVIKTVKDKYQMELIFNWNEVVANQVLTDNLRRFLKAKLHLEWIDEVKKVQKLGNNGTIRIAHGSKSLLISLNESNSRATMTIRGEKMYELIVKPDIHGSLLIFDPIEPFEKTEAHLLALNIHQHIPAFVFNLVVGAVDGSPDLRIISQDKILMDALRKTKKDFIEKCERIEIEQ